MEGEEVDFGDAAELAKEPEAGGSSKGAVRDAAGRRMKGRGAAGSTQTMQDEGGDYDSIDSKGGSTKGPAKCAPRVRGRRGRCATAQGPSPPSPPHQQSRAGSSL